MSVRDPLVGRHTARPTHASAHASFQASPFVAACVAEFIGTFGLVFAGAQRQEHWSFPDPSAADGTEEERLVVFRQVRDAIAARIDRFFQ